MLTVVGMGTNIGDISLTGLTMLQNADKIVLKSSKTFMPELIKKVTSDFETCDSFYEQAADFDQLNNLIMEHLETLCQQFDKVVFCVTGAGYDDSTFQLIKNSGRQYTLFPGVDYGTLMLGYCNNYIATRYTAVDFLATRHFDTQNSLIISGIDDSLTASDVKVRLLEYYSHDTLVTVSTFADAFGITLAELDRQQFSYNTFILIEARELTTKSRFSYSDVLAIIDILRDPQKGCPWDKVQTHQSLTKNVIEEAYELANAIDNGDIDNIIEELGDVLMQVVLHVAIAESEGEFGEADVYTALATKLISRHTHIFGDVKADNVAEALDNWEKNKKVEHKIDSLTQYLNDVPAGMSALLKTQKTQSRAAKYGYDFADVSGALDSLNAEIAELCVEISAKNEEKKAAEGGDLLFSVVNVLRKLGVDCETALLKSNAKFLSRVTACEKILAADNKKLTDLTQDDFDTLWQRVKTDE
jgi:tetrapyrrole methylase family protein/MazG family protein